MTKAKLVKRIDPLAPHLPEVGSKVCPGCLPLPEQTFKKFPETYRVRSPYKPLPHTYQEGVCRLEAPGKPRPVLEPGEEEFLAKQKRRDQHVPF